MKKLFILLLVFTGLGTSAKAQTVSAAITDQFGKMYADAASVDWKEDDKGNFVASFKLGANDAKAVFSKDEAWLKTVIFISEDKFPDAVKATINETFAAGFTYIEAEKVETPEQLKYEAEIDVKGVHFKVLFDKEGNLLTKKEI